jgi:hypothetical protein
MRGAMIRGMAKPMNHKRRLRAAEQKKVRKARDLNALAMLLARKDGHHGDKRKERSRKACRGKAAY